MRVAGHTENLLLCLLAGLLAFVVVPLFMIGNSPGDYTFINISVFIKTAILFSMVLALVLITVYSVLNILGLKLLSNFFVFFALMWILVVGLLLPVSVNAGMVDPENVAVNVINLVLASLAVSVLSIAGLTAARKYLKIFSLVVVISLVPQIYSAISKLDLGQPSSETSTNSLSRHKNILVIDFDGLQGNIVYELIMNSEEHLNQFKDFVYFTNVVSQSPDTISSQVGELYGIRDYKSKGKFASDVITALDDEGLTDELLLRQVSNSYQLAYIQGKPVSLYNDEKAIQNELETIDFFRYPIIRLWTRFSLSYFSWSTRTQKLKEHLSSSGPNSSLAYRLSNHKGPQWEKKNIIQLSLYKTFVEQLSVSDDELAVRFMHFTISHFPVDFDENCNYRSDDLKWYRSNQTERGLREETKCVLNLFSAFLDKLKMLDIYDNSLIVFKSDHGAPAVYFDKNPDSLIINGHRLWGYNRYRPALMIKGIGASNSSMVLEDRLALLNDLPKTLCVASGLGGECGGKSGVDLLGNFNEKDEPYYIYVVKDTKSSFWFGTHISVKIPSRKISLLDAMRESKSITLTEP